MVRDTLFTIKVNAEERRQIAQLAAQEQRSASDAIRLLVRRAIKGTEQDTNDKHQPDAAGVRA